MSHEVFDDQTSKAHLEESGGMSAPEQEPEQDAIEEDAYEAIENALASHHHAQILEHLHRRNAGYAAGGVHQGDLSRDTRLKTAKHGQNPYAVIVTCSDSRVPPEHIFHAGIGELFVIRTAGNVVGDFELGSIEYAVDHLKSNLIIVLGHTGCGAVEAALGGGAHGFTKTITDEIRACLPESCEAAEAERLNVLNSMARIRSSELLRELEDQDAIAIVGGIYDLASGEVTFLGE